MSRYIALTLDRVGSWVGESDSEGVGWCICWSVGEWVGQSVDESVGRSAVFKKKPCHVL